MPYLEKRHRIKFDNKDWIEVEQYHSSMWGNHNKRMPRWRLTPEKMEELNMKRSARNLWRTIRLNFEAGDLYMTFTYRRGERCGPETAKKQLNRFMDRTGYQYKKRGIPFKWIKTTGITENGAIHHHVIMNRVDGIPYHELINKYFPYGRVHTEYLYEQGDYKALAEYFVKHKKENEQIDEKCGVLGYSCSRNLKRSNPKPVPIKESKLRRLPRIPRGFNLIECEEGVTEDGYLYRYYILERKGKKEKSRKNRQKRE